MTRRCPGLALGPGSGTATMAEGGDARLRIAGGDLRGRVLAAPVAAATRPTAAVVREALFAVLAALPLEVGRDTALDLFAGSGALGFEALSRGWREAWFVEVAPAALRGLRRNVDGLGLHGRCHVVAADARRFLRAARSRHFDLILADPPYAAGAGQLVALLAGGEGPGVGVLAVEHLVREEMPAVSGNLARIWSRAYGRTGLSLYAERGRQRIVDA